MDDGLFARPAVVLAPGAVHVPGWLDPAARRRLVAAVAEWAAPPAGMRRTRMPDGSWMSVRTVCLGWHWYPYGYSPVVRGPGPGPGPAAPPAARDPDVGRPVKPFPDWLGALGRDAVAAGADALAPGGEAPFGDPAAYRPDVALVNGYDVGARMGMHADADERSPAPVVSLSLGDACLFRFGNPAGRGRPWTDVELRSGDLLVFGGPSRRAYHGVRRTVPGTGDDPGLPAGRVNITLRESGLARAPGAGR